MPPRTRSKKKTDGAVNVTNEVSGLYNIPGKGLGYNDTNGRPIQVADVGLKLAGSAFSSSFGLKGSVWKTKYYKAKDPTIKYLFVPKELHLVRSKFEAFIDKQSGEDSAFRIRNRDHWSQFIESEEEELFRSNENCKFTIAECTGLQDGLIDFSSSDRSNERYIFDADSMFDSKGESLKKIDCIFFPSLNTKSTIPLLKGFKVKQGSRDLFANCIRVTTPGNFHSCMLACSFGIGQFHGKRLRKSIGGQCPIVVYKSEKKQKMLGKSTTARLVCYLVSDWETNKISPNTSKETTKKKLAGTSTPTYFDDVKRDNWIDRITEGYDGDTYETADGIFPKRAEIFFSANYFSMDGIASSDGERTCDRLAFIPFGEMAQITAEELCRRQELFMKVVSNSHRPTELVIGELGNYIVSEEFKEDIKYFANWLSEKIQVIKSRTIVTNYSWAYAIHWKLFNIFESEWKKMCYSWESFEEWAETVHIPFLISQHIERDNAVNAIRRYFKGVLELIDGLSEAEVLKFCKIIKQKDRNAEFKYVLALHVDKRYSELQCMWSIKVTDVKTHLASVKGRWDNQTSAAFVKDTIHDLGEESVMDDLGTVTKRCMFVPMNVFPSADVQRFVQLTGQSEFMFLVENPEANQETEIDSRNSTQTQPNVPALQELEFDESSIHTNSLNEPDISDDLLDHYSTIKSVDNKSDGSENVPICEDSVSVSSENEIDDLISHMETHKKKNVKKITRSRAPQQVSMAQDVSQENDITQASPNFSKHSASQVDLVASQDPLMVNKSNMSNVTQISQSASKNSTFNSTTGGRKINMINNIYVCECGSSSTSFSGAQRHKCLKEKPLFKCPLCAKSCNNPGSLKLHISHKHKDTSATTAESTSMTVVEEQLTESTSMTVVEEQSTEFTSMTVVEEQSTASKGEKPLHKCQYCSKVCKNAGGLQVHINSKHKEKVLPANSTEKNIVEVTETCSRKTKRRSIGNHKTKTSAKKN